MIELKPKFRGAYHNRAAAYLKKGDYDRAIADYTKMIELDPKWALDYTYRGDAYKEKGDSTRAEADYNKAKELRGEK
ncbi:hypothetical protein ES703_124830 [subsurface metagenome]